MRIFHRQMIELEPSEVREVFVKKLQLLAGEHYIKNGRVIDISQEHPHNGDIMEEDVGPVDLPANAIIVASLKLLELLKNRNNF